MDTRPWKYLQNFQMGFANWPLKPTEPMQESLQRASVSPPPPTSASYDSTSPAASGYNSRTSGSAGYPSGSAGYISGPDGYQSGTVIYKTGTVEYQSGPANYQNGTDVYGYARETEVTESSGFVSAEYKTAATDISGQSK